MTDRPGDADTGAPQLSRDQVAAMLSRLGIRGPDADAVLTDIAFPATGDEIRRGLAQHGISRASALDDLGASP